MNGKRSVSMFVGVAGAALAMSAITSAALAQTNQTTQRPHRSYNMMHAPQHNAQQSSQAQKQETVTLEIRGADSPEGARLLSSALTAHQVDASLQAAQGRPCRVTAEIDPQTDLGAIGKAVMTTNTPDRAQTPPSLDLVVFGRFDKASVKKASDALAKLKGVDAKASNANTSAGEYNIRIDGGAKITANQIRHTLQSAGVWTQFTRNGSARRT
jgi:hypothetical protein